jgi:hypothetical protein
MVHGSSSSLASPRPSPMVRGHFVCVFARDCAAGWRSVRFVRAADLWATGADPSTSTPLRMHVGRADSARHAAEHTRACDRRPRARRRKEADTGYGPSGSPRFSRRTMRACSARIARCSRCVRHPSHTTPTTSPSSTMSSQDSDGGELNGGAGRWQRRQAAVGSPGRLSRSRPRRAATARRTRRRHRCSACRRRLCRSSRCTVERVGVGVEEPR